MDADLTTQVVGSGPPDGAGAAPTTPAQVDRSRHDGGGSLPDADPGPAGGRGLLAGRYRLGELLGRGGVADVHRATDDLLGREVAVKVVRADSPDPAALERFEAEMRTHAGLSHPYLVTVLDAGSAGGRPFLVMELVEGRTLADVAQRPLPVEQVVRLGIRTAAGLAHVHGRGVVHRDVKPANVLLGDDGRVVLSDFGVARLLESDHSHTAAGFTIGTASYFAPEQVTGEAITPAVDVYALGLVLIEALTGERAYPGPPAQAALARLQRDPAVPDGLPPRLAVLLRRMTAASPQARPTAAEVAAQLQEPALLSAAPLRGRAARAGARSAAGVPAVPGTSRKVVAPVLLVLAVAAAVLLGVVTGLVDVPGAEPSGTSDGTVSQQDAGADAPPVGEAPADGAPADEAPVDPAEAEPVEEAPVDGVPSDPWPGTGPGAGPAGDGADEGAEDTAGQPAPAPDEQPAPAGPPAAPAAPEPVEAPAPAPAEPPAEAPADPPVDQPAPPALPGEDGGGNGQGNGSGRDASGAGRDNGNGQGNGQGGDRSGEGNPGQGGGRGRG